MAQFIPVICRSDQGDGGWSLHRPGATDDEIASGKAPALLSGTSRRWRGQWSRPNKMDIGMARKLYAREMED